MTDGWVGCDDTRHRPEHPLSKLMYVDGLGTFNYSGISRESSIDAYDGPSDACTVRDCTTTRLIRAWQAIFPNLFALAPMPGVILRLAWSIPGDFFFQSQAEIYRTFSYANPGVVR